MSEVSASWEERFEALFPAYLLPSAMCRAVDRDVAERLVRRVLGPDVTFATFRASTFLAAHSSEIEALAMRALPDLCRSLRGRTEITTEAHRGKLVGRLDAPRTLAARLRGDRETLVSRVRTRRFDHPPEVAVRAVVVRLREVLASLRRAWSRAPPSWASSASEWERALRSTFDRTTLHRVTEVPFDDIDQNVLLGQRHAAFSLCSTLFEALEETLDSDDPRRIARCVARGALWPLEPWQRFELAVALTLAQQIEARLASAWSVRHTIVASGREEIVAFEHPDGRRLRVFYNQSPLRSRVRQRSLAHYFGVEVSSRPDVVVIGDGPDLTPKAVVIEVKLSAGPSYLHDGFDEAIGYAIDYERELSFPAGSALVVPGRLRNAPKVDDDVVALGWADWQRANVVHDAVLRTVRLR